MGFTMEDVCSSVERLPLELLLEIWRHLIPTSMQFHQKHAPFPLVVSWVNRRWRNFAVGAPELWCYINVFLKQSSEFVDIQLRRSQALPLSIAVDVPVDKAPENTVEHAQIVSHLNNLFTVLRQHLPRWQEFKASIHGSDPMSRFCPLYVNVTFQALQKAFAPTLRRLHIHIGQPGVFIKIFTAGAPRLAHASFRSISITKQIPHLIGLTSLSLDHVCLMPPAALQIIAVGCPTLSRLSFTGRCILSRGTPLREDTVIHFSALLSLSLVETILEIETVNDFGSGWPLVANCFPLFSAPNLLDLHIAKAGPKAMRVLYHALVTNASHSKFPLLSELHLYEVQCTKAHVRDICHCLPSIEILRVDDLGRLPRFECLEALVPDASVQANPVCPNLRLLSWVTTAPAKYLRGRMQTLLQKRIVWDGPAVQLELSQQAGVGKATDMDWIIAGEKAEITRIPAC
ncbi:hypothetical protein NEOLEDRAFT_219545 [Neolentinus lepideus HHB14362 ss-1]|uniref:F-box domain-containing protein n=1 Tax=Neolentinus lepideus HHB14362 ss-1 TaxID=1314782 RepID=A0A165MAX8_9AGAM|nr:hypothetical protein NEOLEDRAFT_219545 [Neolentinus lepideus HHB14362 ss-1]